MASTDLITIGRVGVDIYPQQVGLSLREVTSFGKFLGGSATNVAVAAAKYGLKSAVVTKVGDDPFGEFVKSEISRLGVNSSHVGTVSHLNTPVVFCEIYPPDDFPIYFYREPKAPDMEITAEELDLDSILDTKVFWFTVTGLSEEPSRSAHLKALQHRNRKKHTVIDLDYREMFWESETEATEQIQKVLPLCTVAIGNKEECRVAVGETDPDKAADALLERGVEIAVVKQGPAGVMAKTATGRVVVPTHEVEVVNGLGAGDSFGGAFVYGMNQGWSLEKTLNFANIAGAIVASRLECSTAMPSLAEVMEVMDSK